MKTLIVYAHPNTKGNTPIMLDELEQLLERNAVKYDVLELYEMKYDPVLHEKELYTRGGKTISKKNKDIQKMILGADKLYFIYPIWWGSMPAILKGFFDKIMLPKFAFEWQGKKPVGLLKDKKAVAFITNGAPHSLLMFLGRLPKLHLKRNILGFCGIKCKVHMLGDCNQVNEERTRKFVNDRFSL